MNSSGNRALVRIDGWGPLTVAPEPRTGVTVARVRDATGTEATHPPAAFGGPRACIGVGEVG